MEYNYLVYYVRANAGKTVGQGNKYLKLDHKINIEDTETLLHVLDEDVKQLCNYTMQGSKTLIVNIMELA